MDITNENQGEIKTYLPKLCKLCGMLLHILIHNLIYEVLSILLISLTECNSDEESSVGCRKRVVTFWEVKSTDRVAELNHTHWLSFTSQPQAFEILHTLVSSVVEGKQEQEWIISPSALVFCFTEM